MIKIKDNPKKWKIPTVDGVLQTGYFEKWLHHDKEITESENLIFTAWITPTVVSRGRSSVTFRFSDDDGKHVYHTGPKGMMEITRAIASEKIGIGNGKFYGVFTFKKQGENIYLFPYEKPKT